MRLIVTYATLARPSVTPVSASRRCWRGRTRSNRRSIADPCLHRNDDHQPDQMQERLANSHAGSNLDRTGLRTLIRQSRPARHDLRLVAGVHETTFRVNVRWVTPLGEETASTS